MRPQWGFVTLLRTRNDDFGCNTYDKWLVFQPVERWKAGRMKKKKDKAPKTAGNLPAVTPQRRMCINCVKGMSVGMNSDVLCREKGIVSWNYCCMRHRFFFKEDLLRREYFRCCDCQFFIFHPHPYNPSYGVCGLFSVRKCDGSSKKACSKFVRRKEQTA